MVKYVRKKKAASVVASAPYEKKNPNKKKTNNFDEGEIVLVPDLKPNTLLKRVNKLKNEKGCTKKDAINEVWNKTPDEILIQAKVISTDGDDVVVQYIKNSEGDVYKTKHTYHVGFVARPGSTGGGDTGEEDNEELNDGIANEPEKKKKKKKPIRKSIWDKSSQSNNKKQHTQKKKAAKDSDSEWDGSVADNTDDDDSINSDGGGSEVVSPKKKKADKKVSTSDGSPNGMQITKGTRFSYTFTVKEKPTTKTGSFVSIPNKKGGDYIVKYDDDSKEHTIPQSKLRKFKLLGSGGGGNVDSDEEEEKKQYTKPKTVHLNYSWEERKQQLLEFEAEFGHIDVPIKYKEHGLGRFIQKRREAYRKKKNVDARGNKLKKKPKYITNSGLTDEQEYYTKEIIMQMCIGGGTIRHGREPHEFEQMLSSDEHYAIELCFHSEEPIIIDLNSSIGNEDEGGKYKRTYINGTGKYARRVKVSRLDPDSTTCKQTTYSVDTRKDDGAKAGRKDRKTWTLHRLQNILLDNLGLGFKNSKLVRDYLKLKDGQTFENVDRFKWSTNDEKYLKKRVAYLKRKGWEGVPLADISDVDHLVGRSCGWMNSTLFTLACSHVWNQCMSYLRILFEDWGYASLDKAYGTDWFNLGPIGPASITVFSTNNTLVLNITLPDETRLRRKLVEVSDDTIEILERTIKSVASRDLTEGQSIKDVEVTNVIILENGEVEVLYNLALEELCGDDPCDAQNGIELFEIVTQSIKDQVDDGNFTEELQENAKNCKSDDCSTLKSATVSVVAFDEDPQVQKVTATPTASPSQFDPLSSKSAKRPKSAKTKATKRSGKGRKRKSKSTQSPTSSPAVIGSSSSKGSKGSSSKSQKSSKADRKRKRDHTDQNQLIILEKDEISTERKRRRKHVPLDTSFTLVVDDNEARDEYPELASSKIYRPMRKRKHITITENA